MDSAPPSAAGGGGGYPESTDSSPRSRGGDSWDEPFPSSAAAAAAAAGGGGRLRLMCSFGGRIVPRPTDKSLCYLGGETRIVAVDRNASLADVHGRLSRSLLAGQPFTLKYQLPNEDLDSLISVSTDEDLDNLVDEYDRVAASSSSSGASSRTSRIRLFLFPAKPESSSSLGSLLDDSSKSENWFVDALNSAISGSFDGIPRGISTDSASVNCLLGLEDDNASQHSRSGVQNSGPAEDQRASQQKLAAAAAAAARHQHDVQSVPDSPMLDKNSSFGSTSSAPSLSNLPPIRVRPEDRQPLAPPVSVEDHFAQMGISDQQGLPPPVMGYMQPPPQSQIPAMAMQAASSISPSEPPSRAFSDDDRSDHGGRMQQPPKQEVPPTVDPNNRAMFYNDMSPRNEMKRDMPVGTDASSYRAPAPAPDAAASAAAAQPPPGYVYAQMQPQQQLQQPPQQQLQQQQQQQQHQQQQLQQQAQQQLPQQIQQQPQQQLPPQLQQQAQQQPPQPQQAHQPAPQQYVTAGNQHFIHNPATGTFIPIQSYYQQPVPQQAPQQQQSPAFDPNTGMYYIPMQRPNAPQQYTIPAGAVAPMAAPTIVDSAPKPTVPIPQQYMKPELQQPGMYRTAAPAAPAPGPNTAPNYAGMGYHHVMQSHHHPASQPPPTMAGNYGYPEYAADPRAQVFYSQAGAPPASLPPQYQQPMGAPDASGQADMNQNRGGS
ncbi:ataxin-2 homolog [Hordeum vulgare subsp. vulgare]|uniref:PB1 domain-containing protein n=1 Tax=Hordeum vulgare subsp. vulgare TaxID=112509 RepID=A0A8I7B903_HORVV|nr:ataxin-2 homolog [Hordeum vulgare subsp. vulgare]XP_044974609.1 ataxin-2 homolog [Hordeum vulgare subsp. vulgare]